MAKVLGIDLGTTFSAMATIEGGQPKIIENGEGERTTPSIVAISKAGERLVGTLARRQAITNPANTIYSVKRLIGRNFSDDEVQKDKSLLSYEIRKADNEGVEIKMGDHWYRPQEISAMILQKLKADAEAKLGEKITDVVITCPAYFDDSQRKATKDAGEIAGLNIRRIINEPTAAALAYGLDKKKNQEIVVYDFGGGTFDISVLYVSPDTIEVKGTGGDTHLGGDDFDQRIMDWVIDNFKRDENMDLRKDPLALQRIKEASEKAKKELSFTNQVEINLPFITSDASGPKHLSYSLSRSKLEQLVDDYIKKSIELTKKTVEDCGLKISEIEEVVLVGGQTRMPKIQEEVKKLFNKEPNKEINPDEVVAIGAAVEAGVIVGEMRDVLLLDVTPLSLGIETFGEVNTILIPKNTTIPTSKNQIFSTAADNQTSVEINILQGERVMAKDCKSLGRFILDGIPPAPRGIPQIEVTFDIDVNGILNVTAKDKATGKTQSIRIEGSSGLSKEEIERLKKEAEEFKDQDQKRRDAVETKNNAETLIYTAEKTLRDAGEKISSDLKNKVEEKIKELRDTLAKEEIEAIRTKTNELSQVLSELGASLYQQQKPDNENNKGENSNNGKNSSDEPKDADYEEKN
ncbi:MAG: molecular chaperone DnaK [Candidatus Paceibacterota bacterium]|nr:molecular chaperone DnaK [Candidatus Paceibacterota bacterium]MDD3548546.1 molecular chaperone DnaK [Candidatus Paceibacterota bacterium]MDD4999089.1 molecular chaperone DnaK [Candidatus Paceibacterota bacterium]